MLYKLQIRSVCVYICESWEHRAILEQFQLVYEMYIYLEEDWQFVLQWATFNK